MAVHQIIEIPDPRLRTISAPVAEVTDATRALVADMFDSMYAARGIGPENLNIASLLGRVEGGNVDEVVLAMNATLEGQTTAHYLAERLEGYPVRLTQLAHGLPVGGELDYLDEGTLAQALRARRPVG